MNGINFYSMKIQQISRENPDVHISRVLKALTKNEQEIISIFNLLVTDKEIMNLIDGYYFPKKEEQLANRHFEYDPLVDMSIYYLFDWGVMLLEFYREKMNSFFHMKMQYENALFGENYKEAYNSLRKIVDEFGISEWVYSQEFVLSSLCGDNKNNAKDSFLNNSCAYSNILKIILVYYDKMANSNVNYEDYSNSVSKMLEKENLKSIRGRYLRYKLNINFNKSKSIHDFKSALIIDEQISLVDYYETFIDVLQNLYYQPRMTSLIRSIVYKLHDFLDDYRIRNLYIALGGTIKKVQVDQYINTVIEKYTMGNYTGLINEYQNCSAFGIVDFDLYNIFLKANINIGKLKTPHSKLWNELFSIYNLKYKLGEAVNAIGGYYKLLYNTSWKYKLYGILSRKIKFLFIAIMVVLLVAFPFLLEKLLHTPSQFGFVDGNNHSEWVGYYSSYISGLITLLGVYWTIQFTQEQNQGIIKEENKRFATQLRLENYPLVEIKASTIKRENISSPSIIYYKRQNDNEPKKLLIKFEIKNKGKSIISQASLIFPDNSSELVIINNGLEPNETGSVNVILTALSEKRNEDEAFIFDIHYEDIFLQSV